MPPVEASTSIVPPVAVPFPDPPLPVGSNPPPGPASSASAQAAVCSAANAPNSQGRTRNARAARARSRDRGPAGRALDSAEGASLVTVFAIGGGSGARGTIFALTTIHGSCRAEIVRREPP
ncbi:MAG: hypothetical protein R3B70_23840 [Polyangiaceae bacterium]